MEQRIVNSRFAQDFKNLDKALFWYLKRDKQLNLSGHALSYLTKLCDKLAAEQVTDVTTYQGLNVTDKAFLGLTQTHFEKMLPNFFGEILHPDRKPLCAVVNSCTRLRIEAAKLPYIRDIEEQNKHVKQVKQAIHKEIEKHGNQGLSQFLDQGKYLNLTKENHTQKTTANTVLPTNTH